MPDVGNPDRRSKAAAGTEGPDGIDVGLGVASVARRLGISPGTLRTWDRRYGVGPSDHESGAHRRYAAADLARLTVMRRLMLEGVSPSDAAAAALDADLGSPVASQPLPSATPPERSPRSARRTRGGGGRVVALPDATPAARGLARAAMALDSPACTSLIAATLDRWGVVRAWDELMLPVLHGVGERWRSTGRGVEVEHLLTECVEDGLRAVSRRLTRPLNSRPVVLAAIEPEEHGLPLHALAAALAERQVGVRMLGARLPGPALVAAVARTGAVAVFLWAQGPADKSAGPVLTLPALRPEPALLLGGGGWPPARRPPQSLWLKDLAAAVDAVTAAVGVDTPAPR
ncbi:MAG: MerR family transcriptional regulator, light-induced transcriptional regulator [Actinomycetota bacterium]|nr:MerR family transcriptional regulator, light-induced transcriptional regulator [Actinomycetota bacterium]